MAYNQPVSSRILLRARVAQPATNATLSLAAFTQIDIGSTYISGSPATNFTCPYAGHYEVIYDVWACGGGTGLIQVTSTRSASPVYNQAWIAPADCFAGPASFVIPNCQVGDVITVQANMNTTGTIVSTITTTTTQEQARCTIKFYPSF